MFCTVHSTHIHETHQYTVQGLDPLALDTSILDVSLHTTTYNINSDTSVNFIQEYISLGMAIYRRNMW
jgi:hypothetical protein